MFRYRHRPASVGGFLNRPANGSPGTWRGLSRRAPHTGPGRRYSLLQVLLAGLAVVAALKLMPLVRSGGNRSRLERAVLAALLLAAVSYISRQKHRL